MLAVILITHKPHVRRCSIGSHVNKIGVKRRAEVREAGHARETRIIINMLASPDSRLMTTTPPQTMVPTHTIEDAQYVVWRIAAHAGPQ
jgi:hypothetical protein